MNDKERIAQEEVPMVEQYKVESSLVHASKTRRAAVIISILATVCILASIIGNVVIVEIFFFHVICQHCVGSGFLFQTSIYTSLIQCQRVIGCKHTQVGQDRNVITCMTVTVRRNIHNQRDMEMRSAVYNCFCIFCQCLCFR